MSWHNSLDLENLLGIGLDTLRAETKDNNIEMDKYDRRSFDELVKASPEIKKLVDGEDVNAWSPLVRDVWASYYKYSPELTPAQKVDAPYRAMRPMVEKHLEDKEVQQTRISTVLDELSAGIATIAAGQKLLQEVQNRPELHHAMDAVNQAAQSLQQGNGGQAEALTVEAQAMLQQAARDVRRAVRVAAEAGQQEAEKLNGVLAGWGLEPGDLQRVELGERLNLAKRLLTPKLIKVSDLVGRFRNLARARQKERVDRRRDEVHSIGLGDDLGRVLPVEMAAMRHDTRKLDFYRRYSEKQLLQYDLKAKEKIGRGPIIILVDRSGSMGGQPMEWATATTLALVDTAARQKRKAKVVFFDGGIVQTTEFAPGERDANKLIEIATVDAKGGTNYEPALKEALTTIQNIGYQKADIVMITDGICRVSPEFLEAFLEQKKALGFRAWTVLIGQDPSGELNKWSDEVWPVTKLTEEVAGELFEKVY